KIGDRAGALTASEMIVTRYEANIGLAKSPLDEGRYLVHAAAGPLRAELHDRTLALLGRLEEKSCTPTLPGSLPDWRAAAAVALARRMSETADFATLPILGDALEEAGCGDAEILRHCREVGEHGGRCWVVEMVRRD